MCIFKNLQFSLFKKRPFILLDECLIIKTLEPHYYDCLSYQIKKRKNKFESFYNDKKIK